MPDTGAKDYTDYFHSAYSEILPEFIKSLSGVKGDIKEVFSKMAQLLDEVLDISALSANLAIYWSDNLDYGEKLSIPFFKSQGTTTEEFETVLNTTAEMLLCDSARVPKSYEDDALEGHILAIPICTPTVAHGYAVVFYKSRSSENSGVCTAESRQADFLFMAMYIAAVVIEADANLERFEHFIMNDYLTELPNRTYFYEALVYSLQAAESLGTRFALMIIRVNGLKHINNSLGIIVGDLMLKEMGALISSAVASADPSSQALVGRLSGGDFAVMITYPSGGPGADDDREIVKTHCEAIIKRTDEPVTINNYELYPLLSIGASLYPHHGDTPEVLLRRADMAKSSAKQEGHNCYKMYDDLMEGGSEKLLFLSNNLPVALASNQFELFYQAQAEAATGLITGAEALIRWRHPERGMIYPGDFIAYAEDNGYGIQIDNLVLEMACDQLLEWRRKGIDLTLSVNISPKHFVNGLICDTVNKLLSRTSLDPASIKIELLESILLEDFDAAVRVIRNLQSLGVLIALDDFGAGYSSLEYVAMLPLDYLKIDRTFVMHLEKRPSNAIILKTIMTLAAGMKVKTIAEGVENESQLEFLRSIGCNLVQGYFINKPMPVSEFDLLLGSNRSKQGEKQG